MRHGVGVVQAGIGLLLILSGIACSSGNATSSAAVTSTLTPQAVVGSSSEAVASPSGTRLPTPTPGPNEIRPPELTMVTLDNRRVGIVAANAWYDPETETFSGFEFSGRVILATDPIVWPVDTEATFAVQDTSPFPIGQTNVAFYRYEDNTAPLVNSQGHVIGRDPTYIRQEEPVAAFDLNGPTLTLTNPVPSGMYIIDVTIRWPIPPEAAQSSPAETKTEYVFVVEVP